MIEIAVRLLMHKFVLGEKTPADVAFAFHLHLRFLVLFYFFGAKGSLRGSNIYIYIDDYEQEELQQSQCRV